MMRYASLGSSRFNASSLRKTSGIDVISGAYIFGSAEQQLTADALINAQSFYAASAESNYDVSAQLFQSEADIYSHSVAGVYSISPQQYQNQGAIFSHSASANYTAIAQQYQNNHSFGEHSVVATYELIAGFAESQSDFFSHSVVVSGALSPGTLYNISQIYDASASAGNAIDASLFSNESAFSSHGLSSEYDIVASRVDGTQQFFSGSVYHVLVASAFNSESEYFQPFVSLTLTAGLMDNLQVFPAHVAKTTGKVRPIDSSYSVTQISPYFHSEIIDSSFGKLTVTVG